MQLHYKDSDPAYSIHPDKPAILLVHGLFGSLDNLSVLGRDLQQQYRVIQVDLRNHGRSFHHSQMTYLAMAQDLQSLLQTLDIEKIILIGHSMGGKAVMKLAEMISSQVQGLLILDMAPVAYHEHHHKNVFAGIEAVAKVKPQNRQQAMSILEEYIEIEGVRQFIAKSLYQAEGYLDWRFNYQAIFEYYSNIMGWEPISPFVGPTLFIKGANSDYIQAQYQSEIQAQFPNSKAHIVPNTGHWLHAENPQAVLRVIHNFLNKLID